MDHSYGISSKHSLQLKVVKIYSALNYIIKIHQLKIVFRSIIKYIRVHINISQHLIVLVVNYLNYIKMIMKITHYMLHKQQHTHTHTFIN